MGRGGKNKKKNPTDDSGNDETVASEAGAIEIESSNPKKRLVSDEPQVGDDERVQPAKKTKGAQKMFNSSVTNKHRSARAYSVPDAAAIGSKADLKGGGGKHQLSALQDRMRLKLEVVTDDRPAFYVTIPRICRRVACQAYHSPNSLRCSLLAVCA